jgi:hypothetical protein
VTTRLLIVALAACAGVAGCTADPAPLAGPTASASAAPRTLLTDDGTGVDATKVFEAEGAWDVKYAFDCSSTGRPSDFRLLVQRGGKPVNVLGEANDASSTSGDRTARWPHGGSYSLKVDSPCSWRLEVVEG